MKSLVSAVLACTVLFGASGVAGAQASYPEKPTRFVVPYPPGGIADTFSRALARGLDQKLGQPVIVENKPGASQVIGAEQVARAPADGYTVLLASMTSMATNLGTFKKLKYDPVKDFAPVSRLFTTPLFLAVKADLPVKTVKDLVELAKAKPNEMSYASFGPGSSPHLAGALLSQAAGLEVIHVPYKGSVPALTDVMGGLVTFIFDGGSTAIPQVKAGKLRALAVTGKERAAALPDVPSMAEQGFPSVDISVWWGLVAPAGTPAPVVERLNAAVNEVLRDPEFVNGLVTSGIDIKGSTPQEFAQFIEQEAKRWPQFMQTIGVNAE